ncbi:hypothetical protein FRC08_006723 [Ceratobasidium sp. 394]|nr:hypothetical protein FRC08_006723 [Ceratobasidium sp. 394]
MKLSSSNLALATLALSPNLLSSPVFAAPTPDVGGVSPNPNIGYFADSPQPQAVDSPLLQSTPTFSGPPTSTGTPPTSKIAGMRRSISMSIFSSFRELLTLVVGRRSSARLRAADPASGSPGLGLGLGIGFFGSSVHIRAASPVDPGNESLASEGLPASATSAAASVTPALVKPEVWLDDPNPPSPSVVPVWLVPHDALSESPVGDPSSRLAHPKAGREGSARATEYQYPQHDARDARLQSLESPFLNSPVPHDSPTFPPAVHRRQSVSIPVIGGSPLVGSVPGVVPGMIVPSTVPLAGLPLGLGPNGLPISAPNLDALPLQNLENTGLPLPAPLGGVSSLPSAAGISFPAIPNVNSLPLVGGVGTAVSGVSNNLEPGSLPLPGVASPLGTVDQVLRPVTYPLAVLGENPHAAPSLADPASKLPSPYHLQETGAGVVGGQVQGIEGVVSGVGAAKPVVGLLPVPGAGLSGVDPGVVSGAVPGVISGVVPGVVPGGVPGANLPGSVLGHAPLPGAGTLPVPGATPPFVPIPANQQNQAAAVPSVVPNPVGIVSGVAPIPVGGNVLGGQGIGPSGVAGAAPGLAPGVGTLPVSVPVPIAGAGLLPVPGANSLPVPAPGQLGSATAPVAAVPGLLGPISKGAGVPIVPNVVGASGGIPGPVGAAPGLVPAAVPAPSLIPTSVSAPSILPASVSAPVPTGTPLPGLVPKKGDLGVPVVDSPPAAAEGGVGVYKATGGTGAMGRLDEEGHRASPVSGMAPTPLSISVPPAHATAAPLSIAPTSSVPAPPSQLDGSNSSGSSSSDDEHTTSTTTMTESARPTPMYHGGSPLSRVPELSPERLAPVADATRTVTDAFSSVSGAANPTGSLRWGEGLPKMVTSVARAATVTASAPTPGQTN